MDWTIYYHLSAVLGLLLLAVLLYAGLEFVRILTNVRRLTDRVELLTDVRGWFSFFKRFSDKRKSK